MPVIWLTSGPGPKAKHLSTHFEQESAFTSDWQRRLMGHFGIQYIGSWHSHHTLSLNHPSSGDVKAAMAYAVRHGRQRTHLYMPQSSPGELRDIKLDGMRLWQILRGHYGYIRLSPGAHTMNTGSWDRDSFREVEENTTINVERGHEYYVQLVDYEGTTSI